MYKFFSFFNTYCQYSSKNVLQRPTVDNAFKSKNGCKILYTQISWGTLLTHREEDKRVRRGKAAAKGATVIFWRLGGVAKRMNCLHHGFCCWILLPS